MQRWPAQRMESYQRERLAEVLISARDTPFYSGMIPEDSRVRGDPVAVLKTLPVLDKKTVSHNTEAFLSRGGAGSRLVKRGTSGTTGFPLRVYWNRSSMDWERALIWRHRLTAGCRLGRDWMGMLGGHRIVPTGDNSPPFWRECVPARISYLSTYHISPGNAPHYHMHMEDRKISFLSGYPSALYALALSLKRNGMRCPIQGIFYGAEPLHDFQRSVVESVFECHVWDFYGLTERVVSASEFECRNGLHLNWENSYFEILDPSGADTAPGENGELVGTSLSNTVFTLLRYRTGDVTRILEGECPCGRQSARIAPIETKVEDLFVMPDGKLISASNLTIPFKVISHVRQAQIYQKEPGELVVKIVPEEGFNPEQAERLSREIQSSLPDGVAVRIQMVDSIPVNRSGKYSFAVSEVNRGG